MPSLADMRSKAKEAGLMKLDKLIAKRQSVPTNEFPIPVKELCERFEKLYTGCVNDVMREACLLDQNLPHEIMPLRDEMVVCGEAFTVKSAPNCMIEGEMTFRAQMLDDFKPNGVVVWDTSDDVEASLWGGVMTATAMTKGIRGAVIAGGIRDTKQILEQKFPIFYKYRVSNGSLGRCMITHYQVPVRIGKHRRRNLHSARDRLRSPAPRRGNRAQRGRHLLVGSPGRHHKRDYRQGRVFLITRPCRHKYRLD